MSRLLLYRPRQLDFKGYICSIEQYHTKYEEAYSYLFIYIAKYSRLDILEKYYFPPKNDDLVIMANIGRFIGIEKITVDLTVLNKTSCAVTGMLVSAVYSGFIDLVYKYRHLYAYRHLIMLVPEKYSIPAMRAIIYLVLHNGPIEAGVIILRDILKNYISTAFPGPEHVKYVGHLIKYMVG